MRIKIVWPGNKEARGLAERMEKKILTIEANGLEKRMKDDYIICLFDRGKEMHSEEFAHFLQEKKANSVHTITFIVGGFLGLADGILKRAHFLLSLSKMTFSQELTRIVLLEQIYRSLTIMHGRQYAK